MTTPTPAKFPLFRHRNGQWAKKIEGKLRYFGPVADPQAALARFLGLDTPSKVTPSGKPPKPHKDFPLFAHASGQWAKKVRGKLCYFGSWADPDAALNRWLAEKDELLAGRVRQNAGKVTLRDLVNRFLTSKQRLVESGELDSKTWYEYDNICKQVLAGLGKETLVSSLRPADFERLRDKFAKGHSVVTLGNLITRSRVLFNYAYKNDLIDRPVKYGEAFSKPKRAVLRKERKRRGKRLFAANEIHLLLNAAGPQLKAMILLGVNCGLGNTDCAKLCRDNLDLDGGWIDYPRPKTGIDRRCPLWPETVAAIKDALAARPKHRETGAADRVFITCKGLTWEGKSKAHSDAPVTKEIAKLLKVLGIKRKGINFYALRHVFQTIGEQARDKDAVRCIMGHCESANDMSAVYSEERPSDERLRAVVDHVHAWLFNKTQSRQPESVVIAADAA